MEAQGFLLKLLSVANSRNGLCAHVILLSYLSANDANDSFL